MSTTTLKNTDQEQTSRTFTKAALAEFAYLTARLGFRCGRADDDYVRFESARVFVDVTYDRFCDLAVSVGRLTDSLTATRESYDLPQLLKSAGASDRLPGYPIQVGSDHPQQLRAFVAELAHLVRDYAVPALSGDRAAYEQLREIARQGRNHAKSQPFASVPLPNSLPGAYNLAKERSTPGS